MSDYSTTVDDANSFQDWAFLVAGTCLAATALVTLAGMAFVALVG